jgi:hypothetical protein
VFSLPSLFSFPLYSFWKIMNLLMGRAPDPNPYTKIKKLFQIYRRKLAIAATTCTTMVMMDVMPKMDLS